MNPPTQQTAHIVGSGENSDLYVCKYILKNSPTLPFILVLSLELLDQTITTLASAS